MRTFAVLGLSGLAQQFVEVDASAFLSHRGDVSLRAEAEVAYRGLYPPAPNQIYWVPDFAGDQVLAQRVAHDTARALEDDPVPGNLNGISANPDLVQHAPFFMYLDEDEPDGRLYRRGYAATIYEVELDCVAATMDLSYEALRVTSEEVTLPADTGRASDYAVLSERALVPWVDQDSRGLYIDMEAEGDWFGESLDGLWIDPELAADEDPVPAGEGADGLWVDVSIPESVTWDSLYIWDSLYGVSWENTGG